MKTLVTYQGQSGRLVSMVRSDGTKNYVTMYRDAKLVAVFHHSDTETAKGFARKYVDDGVVHS